jgi:hypothetical protein
LLGLTPQERQQLEAELQTHFAAMDGLIENHVCETNRGSLLYIPPKAVASQVWTVPALGDEVQTKADELEARLQETLGPERWPLVKAQLEMISTDSLRRILNLDASQNAQEVGVWISETGGKQTVGSGWSSRGSSFSFDGADLGLFLPRGDSGADRVEYIGSRSLPSALTGRMMAWIQQQAVARLGGAAK